MPIAGAGEQTPFAFIEDRATQEQVDAAIKAS